MTKIIVAFHYFLKASKYTNYKNVLKNMEKK